MPTKLELDGVFHPLPTLAAERLVLQPARQAHASALFRLFADPRVMERSHEPPHESPEVTARHVSAVLKRHEDRTGISWVLIPKGATEPIGFWNGAAHDLRQYGLLVPGPATALDPPTA